MDQVKISKKDADKLMGLVRGDVERIDAGVRCEMSLSGSYLTTLTPRDRLSLPRRAPSFVEVFGGHAFHLCSVSEDGQESNMLLPGRLVKGKFLSDDVAAFVKSCTTISRVNRNGEVVLPGLSESLGIHGRIAVAGCGDFAEVMTEEDLAAELFGAAEEVDSLFDNYSGLPTGTA